MNVCSRCTLDGDDEEIILWENASPRELLDYDPLGFTVVAIKLEERTKEGVN
jgi:hypothetical protein